MSQSSCGGSHQPTNNGRCRVCGQSVATKRDGKAKMHQPPKTSGYGRKK